MRAYAGAPTLLALAPPPVVRAYTGAPALLAPVPLPGVRAYAGAPALLALLPLPAVRAYAGAPALLARAPPPAVRAYAGTPALLTLVPPPAVRALASLRRLCTPPFGLAAGVRAVGLPLPFRSLCPSVVVRLVVRASSHVRAVFRIIGGPVFGSFFGGLVDGCAVAVGADLETLCVKLSSGFGGSAASGSP